MFRKAGEINVKYGDPFVINVDDDNRNRQLKIFDVVSYLAGKSPLKNTRISQKTGELKEEDVFSVDRIRNEVFSEPTNLYEDQLINLEDLVTSDDITVKKLKKALGAFGNRTTSQLNNYRFGSGLDVHHTTSVASVRKLLNHLPVEEAGQVLKIMADQGNVGNTHVTQELHPYFDPEHNAAHYAVVSGLPYKKDAMRNFGDVTGMKGKELADYYYDVTGNLQTKLAENVDEYAYMARELYAQKLKERAGLEVKPEQLGSSVILPGNDISISKLIKKETDKRLKSKGAQQLSQDVVTEMYPDGVNSIIPTSRVIFDTPAQIEKMHGRNRREKIEKIRESAAKNNRNNLQLHPGSVEELSNAVKLREMIDLLGVSI